MQADDAAGATAYDVGSDDQPTPAAETFGPCIFCGREQTRNPHPNAGLPGHTEAGYAWHCVPCLEENRHRWAVRARVAEGRCAAAAALADKLDPTSGSARVGTFVGDLTRILRDERV